MHPRNLLAPLIAALAALALIAAGRQVAARPPGDLPGPAPAPKADEAPAPVASTGVEGLGLSLLSSAKRGQDGRMQARLPDGRIAHLTLDPALQLKLEKLLASYAVPYGVAVAVEPATGRILAVAEHSERDPEEPGTLADRPMSPAASIFKLVTAAALLEDGVQPEESVCYHGGKRRIQPGHLTDSSRDRSCTTMAEALGRSINVAFAKLAQRHLTPLSLRRAAGKLFFNEAATVDGVPLPRNSPAEIPDEPFPFATTAAGFSPDVRLTPVHAALLAAAVANGGLSEPLRLVDDVGGEPVPESTPERVLPEDVARKLGDMMLLTVSEGTARRAFSERRRPVLPMAVAGKTGSLDERDPFRDHTWFVGFAPASKPTIAVATLIVNDPRWRIRAPFVAREALRSYLVGP